MKPGGPLKRRKGLTATTRLQARTPLERGTPLRYRSAKTAAQYVARRRIVAEMFLCPEMCEVPDCASVATDPHEPLTRARGGDILNLDNIRRICAAHHRELHDHEPEWGYALGFLVHSWDGDAA